MNREITIRLADVAKSFGETKALKKCDFEAHAGEVHAIVGENGSGKSTMAKIMSGVLHPDSGTVSILGEKVNSPIDAKKIGLTTIFQEVLVADEASVFENLFVGRDGVFKSQSGGGDRRAEANEILTRLVGKSVDLDQMVGGLPLSIKQWIVIARAMLRRPRVLILDESSAALDLDSTIRLHEEIDRLRREGATVLIVTHRIAELVRIADRATILRDGVTVGTLQKHEITEENLLSMMTPPDRRASDVKEYASKNRAIAEVSVMTAKNMVAQRTSAPFDFDLPKGSIVGVAGLDGQGQDAFVRALVGIMRPFGGDVLVRSAETGKMVEIATLEDAASAGISYVSGDRKREGIFPQQSIFENLAIGVYRKNLGPMGIIRKPTLKPMFKREVDRLRIKIGSPSNKITSLSGGNQQKVLIGRAFANDPQVIVLNDPARGVDLGTKRDLYRELRAFVEKGGSVIYLSSEIEEFIGFADRVDVFFAGRLFRSLSGDHIAEEPILAAMFGKSENASVEFDLERSA
ncbi:sugar ABC transporter ATP-binding protein [Rhizobium chutanense]|uniref:Sugar ABC transporter ATP-binding protein n=1 Tax=Rhizobium chutanense TaxID=2035448 RepID=A0A2A6J722_9HYPH|nr:sugar ABC transporter ATP-binding protein [Rhizobium chutanense]PDT01654.1 sugar ABC transporter ATP-binding protein [Rhizobium chutanense]RUM01156.1 sugar ABC transporter ATP-binding protein [Rhizobium chutanense]